MHTGGLEKREAELRGLSSLRIVKSNFTSPVVNESSEESGDDEFEWCWLSLFDSSISAMGFRALRIPESIRRITVERAREGK